MYVRLPADAFISVVLFFQVLIDQEKTRRGGPAFKQAYPMCWGMATKSGHTKSRSKIRVEDDAS